LNEEWAMHPKMFAAGRMIGTFHAQRRPQWVNKYITNPSYNIFIIIISNILFVGTYLYFST
jgi:hypothetical protein